MSVKYDKISLEDKTGGENMGNSYTFRSPIGFLTICEQDNQLTRLYLNHSYEEDLKNKGFEHHSDFLYEVYHQLNEYFAGKRRNFELPVKGQGTAFQKAVWRELQEIPYGETRSYEDIAVAIGNKKAVRAIGQANGRNPIMIVVPCHRVIRKNGDISGFACGVEAKRYLLNLERENSINQL